MRTQKGCTSAPPQSVGFGLVHKDLGRLVCENLRENPRVLTAPSVPWWNVLNFFLPAFWSWLWGYQSLPASVHHGCTCWNHPQVVSQKNLESTAVLFMYFFNLSCTTKISTLAPSARGGIYPSVWNNHWTGIKSSKHLPPCKGPSEVLWPCFQMINLSWLPCLWHWLALIGYGLSMSNSLSRKGWWKEVRILQ